MSKVTKIASVAVMLAGAVAANEALAQGGFATNVINQCASAGNPAPTVAGAALTEGNCLQCHVSFADFKTSTTAMSSYKSGGNTLLNYFCPAPTTTTTSTTSTTTTSTTTTTRPTTTTSTTTTAPTTTTTAPATTSTTTTAPATTSTTTTAPATTSTTTTRAPTTTTVPSTACTKRNPSPILDIVPDDEIKVEVNQPVHILASAYDKNGSVASLTAKVGRRLVELTPEAAVSPYTMAAAYDWTPTVDGVERKVTFTAKDNCGKSTSQTVEIKVEEADDDGDDEDSKVNTAPQIVVPTTLTATAGETTTVPVSAIDADGNKVSLSVKGAGAKLAKKVRNTDGSLSGDLTLKPAKSAKGKTLSVKLTAKDNAKASKKTVTTVAVEVK